MLFSVHDTLAWLNDGPQLWPDYGFSMSAYIKDQVKDQIWANHFDYVMGQPASFQSLQSKIIILQSCFSDPLDITVKPVSLYGCLVTALTNPSYFLRSSPDYLWSDLLTAAHPISALRLNLPKLLTQVSEWTQLPSDGDLFYVTLHGQLSYLGLTTALALTLAMCYHTQLLVSSQALKRVEMHLRSSLTTLQGVFQYDSA